MGVPGGCSSPAKKPTKASAPGLGRRRRGRGPPVAGERDGGDRDTQNARGGMQRKGLLGGGTRCSPAGPVGVVGRTSPRAAPSSPPTRRQGSVIGLGFDETKRSVRLDHATKHEPTKQAARAAGFLLERSRGQLASLHPSRRRPGSRRRSPDGRRRYGPECSSSRVFSGSVVRLRAASS